MNDREVKRSLWLSEIYPDFECQTWHSEKIIREENVINYRFFKSTNKTYITKINPKDIVGISRIGYNYHEDTTWLKLFYSLKRIDEVIKRNKCLEDLISHINNPNIGKKTVIKYNDHYIAGLGLHRLCLSKFLDLKEVEVEVNEYSIDQAKFNFFHSIEKIEKHFRSIQFLEVQYESVSESIFCIIDNKPYYINKELLERLFHYLSTQRQSLLTKTLVKFSIYKNIFSSQNTSPIKIESINDFKKIKL